MGCDELQIEALLVGGDTRVADGSLWSLTECPPCVPYLSERDRYRHVVSGTALRHVWRAVAWVFRVRLRATPRPSRKGSFSGRFRPTALTSLTPRAPAWGPANIRLKPAIGCSSRVLDRLRRAGGQPVTLDELRAD